MGYTVVQLTTEVFGMPLNFKLFLVSTGRRNSYNCAHSYCEHAKLNTEFDKLISINFF